MTNLQNVRLGHFVVDVSVFAVPQPERQNDEQGWQEGGDEAKDEYPLESVHRVGVVGGVLFCWDCDYFDYDWLLLVSAGLGSGASLNVKADGGEGGGVMEKSRPRGFVVCELRIDFYVNPLDFLLKHIALSTALYIILCIPHLPALNYSLSAFRFYRTGHIINFYLSTFKQSHLTIEPRQRHGDG